MSKPLRIQLAEAYLDRCAHGYCRDQPACHPLSKCNFAEHGPTMRPKPEPGVMGHIYLLHFSHRVGHAQHYIGWAMEGGLFKRLAQHESGNGRATPLIRALIASGGRFRLARVWDGDRHMERRLKRRKGARQLCPICRGEVE